MGYNHKEIEKKWQKYWEENQTFKTPNPGDKDFDETKPKYYVLDMFPYPSGAGLHVGHPEGYTANDIIARYKKARGYNVLHPMGWDAFGLPAENYAIKTGTHPKITTEKNIDNFRKQIKSIGFSYDWSREINTTDPSYYKWTQWIFLKMFEHGLAYEQNLPINYCPSCKTGLANEEVLKDGTCDRCGTKVEKKPIRQWVLAITKYADRLAKDVDKLDWPEGIKEMQKQWIGKSEGTQFKMDVISLRSEEEKKVRRENKDLKSGKDLKQKKGGMPLLSEGKGGHNDLANSSSEHNIFKTIPKVNRKIKFFGKLDINGIVDAKIGKISFNSKNILKHFKTKHFKEFINRKNLLLTVFSVIDQVDFDENLVGYFAFKSIIIKVVLGKQSNGNYFVKSYYKNDKLTDLYKEYLNNQDEKIGEIEVYTTRIDTVFGMSYAVIAPDHKNVEKFIQKEQKEACYKYIEEAKHKSDLDRTADNKEKTGVFTGSYVINPYNGKKVPLWIADYVLGHYGTGAVMAVPAHDERDFAFAKKYGLEIIQSIAPENGEKVKLPYTEYGILINSGKFNGLTSQQAKKVLTEYAEKEGFGFKKVNYKLRDWIFSRQRYWGEPIPLIHLAIEDIKKLEHISEKDFNDMKEKLENYLKQKMRGATPSKKEVVAPLGNTANLSLVDYITENIKKINRKLSKSCKLKEVYKEFDIDGKKIIFNGRYLLEHFKVKSGKEVNLRKRIARVILSNFDKGLFIGNCVLFNINGYYYIFILERLSNGKYNILTYYSLNTLNKFLNKAYILKRAEKEGENIPETAKCKHTGLVRELIINGKVFSKIYDGIEGKIVCDYNLPLTLPEVEKYKPAGDGQSPLANVESFVNIKLAKNLSGKRETNTMPQWGGSCWYYLRYMDPHNDKELVNPEIEKYWGQVDSYVGGAEHAVLHLLYARFWHKFLYDINVVSYDEPFYRLRNQGLILSHAFEKKNGGLVAVDLVEEKDGKYYHKETGEELKKVVAKMSKSLKNVVNPDDIIKEYGADTLRLYEMYLSDFKDSAPWDTKGIVGVRRFLEKVARYFIENEGKLAKDDNEAIRLLHKSIKKVSEDIENYKFNTAIAQLMILLNYGIPKDEKLAKEWKLNFVKLLHPFAPHIAEEIYQNYLNLENKKESIFFESWPEYDEKLAKDDVITMAVQVMGKVRATIQVSADSSKEEILNKAKQEENVRKWIDGKKIVKEIYVPGKLVNLVIK